MLPLLARPGSPFVVAAMVAALALSLAPASVLAEGGLSERLLSLHEASTDYSLQRDTLSGDGFVADEALAALASHPDWRVRQQSEVILGWRHRRALFAEVSAAAPVLDRAGRPIFAQAQFRDPAARPAVVERLLHGGESPKLRAALASALIGLRADWDQLNTRLLRDEAMPDVREALVWSMRRAAAAPAGQGIALGLGDDVPSVRAEACRSVGWRSDGADYADQLLKAVRDADAGVRAMAARALGWREVGAAFGPLLPLLSDPSADVRLHSLRALSRIDESATVKLPNLAELLSDPDPRVARVAARLLGR